MSENTEVQIEDWELQLEPNNEFRFEVKNKNEDVIVKLKSGQAEIYGMELKIGMSYVYNFGVNIIIFSIKGCTLQLRGKKGIGNISKEPQMVLYSNFHSSLEQLRVKSEKEKKPGPITMVVGPAGVGKSTMSRLLLNYSVGMKSVVRTPIYVDLNPQTADIALPSSIGALKVDKPVDIIDSYMRQGDPLIYHYGHTSPSKNPYLFGALVSYMGDVVLQKMKETPTLLHSGLIINTTGWVTGRGFEHLIHISHSFQVDVVLVLDDEDLFIRLRNTLPNFVKIVHLPKIGGVLKRCRQFRSQRRMDSISEYIFGISRNETYVSAIRTTYALEVKFSDIKVFRFGPKPILHVSLSSNVYLTDGGTGLIPVTPGPSMLRHILSVSACTTMEGDISMLHYVRGHVCVISVDILRQTLSLLCAHPSLPSKIFLLSDVKFLYNLA